MESWQKEKLEVAKNNMNLLIEEFGKEEFPEKICKAYINAIGKPCESWSLQNKFFMLISGTTDGRTLNAWRQVGRFVRDWTTVKPFYVLVPSKVTIQKIGKDEKTGEDVTIQFMRFYASKRYTVEDTYGQKLEEYKPSNIPPLMDIAKKWFSEIKYSNSAFGEYGSYEPGKNILTLSTESIDTFFHELTHKADEKAHGKLKAGQDVDQEITAQLTACILSKMYGYDARSYTFNYIKNYANAKTPEQVAKHCMRLMKRVDSCLKVIFEACENKELVAQ